jgi:hypothetical protein
MAMGAMPSWSYGVFLPGIFWPLNEELPPAEKLSFVSRLAFILKSIRLAMIIPLKERI